MTLVRVKLSESEKVTLMGIKRKVDILAEELCEFKAKDNQEGALVWYTNLEGEVRKLSDDLNEISARLDQMVTREVVSNCLDEVLNHTRQVEIELESASKALHDKCEVLGQEVGEYHAEVAALTAQIREIVSIHETVSSLMEEQARNSQEVAHMKAQMEDVFSRMKRIEQDTVNKALQLNTVRREIKAVEKQGFRERNYLAVLVAVGTGLAVGALILASISVF